MIGGVHRLRSSLHLLPPGLLAPAVIIVLGLAPAFWAPWDVILISEDLALPRVTQQFLLTMHSWNPILNTGTSYNVANTAIFVFAQQSGLQALGFDMAITQRIIFLGWMILPGLSIYLLVRILFRTRLDAVDWQVSAVVAASFYMFNLYMEHAWRGFNVAVLSAQTALPLLLALLYLGLRGRVSVVQLGLFTLPVAIWAAGVGVNPPMVLVFVGTIIGFLAAYLFFSRTDSLSTRLVSVIRTVGVVGSVSFIVNSFWILPFVGQLGATSAGELTTSAGLASSWLQGISANTSFSNVLRFQGDWTWYQGWREPYHAYSSMFRESPLLATLSWLTPSLALLGLLGSKGRLRFYFAVIAIAGLLLSMGVHEPMKGPYLWLVQNAPLFWIIRSPWFKFGLVTALGFAVLSGLGVSVITSWFRRAARPALLTRLGTNRVSAVTVVLVVAANLAYAYPVTTGQMLPAAEDREFLPPNQMRIPDYAIEASSWFDENIEGGRVAALPDTTVWADENGFVGFGPMLTQIGTSAIVYPFHSIPGSLVSATNSQLNDIVYESLYRATTRRADEILKLLSVKYLNHETGIKYWLYAADIDSADWVRSRLKRQLAIQFERSFGPWDVYAVPNALPHFYTAPSISLVVGGVEALPAMVGLDVLETPAIVFSDQQNPEDLSRVLDSPLLENLMFFASGPEELALDLIPSRYRHSLPQLGIPVALELGETTAYRFWLRSPDPSLFPSGDLAVDGQPFDLGSTQPGDTPLWTPLGTHTLSKGTHLLTGTIDSVPGQIVVVPETAFRALIDRVDSKLADNRIQITIMASTEGRQITTRSAPELSGDTPIAIQFGDDVPVGADDDIGSGWRWLQPDGAQALVVVNSTPDPVTTSLALEVQSLEISRDFFLFMMEGDRKANVPLIVQELAADRPTEILVRDVEIRPGENRFAIYTAHAGTVVGDETRNFAIRDDSLRSGGLIFEFAFDVYRPDAHRLEIRPYTSDRLPEAVTVELDGRSLELSKLDVLGEPTFVATTSLEAGTHTLVLTQKLSENFVIRVVDGAAPNVEAPLEPVRVISQSPTAYVVETATDDPAILVFGESFDPRWEVKSDLGPVQPFRVNGFANGFVIPAGAQTLRLYFGPQTLFVTGAIISLATVWAAVLVASGLLLKKWKARRNRSSH